MRTHFHQMSLVIQNLSKVYGSQKAIHQLNFEVPAGQILGFLGQNGAGKSTTMKIITGYIEATEGNVFLDEQWNIQEHPLEIRKRIGYLPENNPLYYDMYVHEFLEFIAGLYQIPKNKISDQVAEMIKKVGLEKEQHKKIGALSKGYKQRVGLAQAMIHDPQILILDEPTTGLDPNQIVEIRNLIKELGQTKTVIFSSHNLFEVESIAHRVIIINRGEMILDSNIQDLSSLAQRSYLIVEFEKEGFPIQELEKTNGILSVEKISETSYKIQVSPEIDVRKSIVEMSVNQGNAIVLLQKESQSLEDIFKQFTNV